jgi:hypothetical protein
MENNAMENTFTIAEAARLLGISRQYVHRLLGVNNITPERVNAPIGGMNYYYTLTLAQVEALRKVLMNGSRRPYARRPGPTSASDERV